MTKASLKTHAVFDTIRSIFERNPEVVGGSDSKKEKAWKLMTKIVNSLSAKMEMGNLMIYMYLLGNLDHYKSHAFRTFYWMSFVNAARSPWVGINSCGHKDVSKTSDTTLLDPNVVQDERSDTEVLAENEESKEKVAILKCGNQFIGLSPVHDYIYRCKELHNLCLYDWIARCERTKLPNKRKSNSRGKGGEDGIAEGNSDIDESLSLPRFRINKTTSCIFPLLLEHPLAGSHGTRCCPVSKEKVPNFVGPMLPRCDQGDCEFYCSIMLTLFKPWRSGLELKTQEQSWDDAFSTHGFSARQTDIMRYMNIRYECLDARDDFHAQLAKGDVGICSWEDVDMQAMQDMDGIATGDSINVVQDDSNVTAEGRVHDLSNELGKREMVWTCLISEMRAMLQNLGWTENIPGLLDLVIDLRPPPPNVKLNGVVWKTIVAQKRAEVLQLHVQNMPATLNSMSSPGAANDQFVPDDVCVVKKCYLSHSFVLKEWEMVIEDICNDFNLNREQGHAF